MQVLITGVELEDQDMAFITCEVFSGHDITTHELTFDPLEFAGLSTAEILEKVKTALRKKLVAELQLADLLNETFTLETIYRKAYAD